MLTFIFQEVMTQGLRIVFVHKISKRLQYLYLSSKSYLM